MTAQSLQIKLTSPEVSGAMERRFVHLTQPVENGMDETASLYDLSQMVARARSGMSAHTYKKDLCQAKVSATGIEVRLDFEVWPSSPELYYTLSSNIGAISHAEIIDEYTEFSLIFGKTDAVELDFILAEITSYYWETPCYTPSGVRIDNQEIAMDGLTTVRTDEPIFGVVRIKGKKIGARHCVVHNLINSYPIRPDEPIPDEGISADDLEKYWAYTDVETWNGVPINAEDTVDMTGLSLDNLNITITAKWTDVYGEEAVEAMTLNVPQCIQDLLSNCEGDLENFLGGGSSTSVCDLSERPEHTTVYVSSCSGKVLEERTTKDDPDTWCAG